MTVPTPTQPTGEQGSDLMPADDDSRSAIGLRRGTVAVRAYDQRWPIEFAKEAAHLAELLGPSIRIEHVGSTAVPNLAAKPLIDIAVGFEERQALDEARHRLREAGYDDRGDFGARGGVIVAKGPEDDRTHLLHLVEVGDPQWQRYLDFRDALRGDDALRDEYAALKLKLARTYWLDRDAYLSGKQPLIERVAAHPTSEGADPYAHLKDRGWREVARIDARLERGELDEAGWHRAMANLVVPAYLAAHTPWEGSGKSGTAEDWEYARGHIADAINHDGSFLDVGCANGYLLECLPRWTPHALDRYGLDIAPELVDLARRRQPELADQLSVGNALRWQPTHRFSYVRTGLEYVPRGRRRELVERLLGWCERLIIGVFSEESHARPTEELLRSWGFTIAGHSERSNRDKPGMEYRVLWIDAR